MSIVKKRNVVPKVSIAAKNKPSDKIIYSSACREALAQMHAGEAWMRRRVSGRPMSRVN